MGYVLSVNKKDYIASGVDFKFRKSEISEMCDMASNIAKRLGYDLEIKITMEDIECCDEVKDE